MRERVLITGASGFIGYHLIDEAIKNNLDVYITIRKSSNADHLANFNIKYIYADFADVLSLKRQLEEYKFDYIIHAAGVTRARSQQEYNQVNADYTFNLAQAAVDSGIKLKKFVLISSLAGVGPLTTLDDIITEATIPRPITAYGKSKLLAEEKLKSLSSLNYTILRPTGVYGPRDRDIFIFFKQVARGIEPYIGHVPQKFSFLYVTDLAKATIKALYAGGQKAYNLSDGNFYGRYELAAAIKNALSSKTVKFHLPVNFVKLIAYFSEKYSSLSHKAAVLNMEKIDELMAVNWFCDIGPARTDLSFSPEFDLRAGVAASITWYKTNKWL